MFVVRPYFVNYIDPSYIDMPVSFTTHTMLSKTFTKYLQYLHVGKNILDSFVDEKLSVMYVSNSGYHF